MPKNEKKFFKVHAYQVKPTDIELRECPLCGAEPVMTYIFGGKFPDNITYTIECANVMCSASLKGQEIDGVKHIADRWNKRYDD